MDQLGSQRKRSIELTLFTVFYLVVFFLLFFSLSHSVALYLNSRTVYLFRQSAFKEPGTYCARLISYMHKTNNDFLLALCNELSLHLYVRNLCLLKCSRYIGKKSANSHTQPFHRIMCAKGGSTSLRKYEKRERERECTVEKKTVHFFSAYFALLLLLHCEWNRSRVMPVHDQFLYYSKLHTSRGPDNNSYNCSYLYVPKMSEEWTTTIIILQKKNNK